MNLEIMLFSPFSRIWRSPSSRLRSEKIRIFRRCAHALGTSLWWGPKVSRQFFQNLHGCGLQNRGQRKMQLLSSTLRNRCMWERTRKFIAVWSNLSNHILGSPSAGMRFTPWIIVRENNKSLHLWLVVADGCLRLNRDVQVEEVNSVLARVG